MADRSNPAEIERLIYVSRAVACPDEPDLYALAASSAARNRAVGVTGLLLYGNQHFVQCLEGSTSSVLGLFEVIARDSRHTEIKILDRRRADNRLYPCWSMRLLSMDTRMPPAIVSEALLLRACVDNLHDVPGRIKAVGLLRTLEQRMAA